MPKTIDRLLLFIRELGLSARQFDISIGSANGYTLRMHKNKASVGSDVIEKIVNTYPQINLVWLITGKGDMLVHKQTTLDNGLSLDDLDKLIEEKIEAKLLDKNNHILQGLLKDIENEIRDAKKK